MQHFIMVFSELDDPRAENAQHKLLEVLFIAFAATLCGASSCTEMAEFGAAKEALLRQFLELEYGVPSHDTFSRVFRLLDPKQFEAAFGKYMAAIAGQLSGVVAIDGKAVRGAFVRGARTTPLHLVNVWAADQRLALAQCKAPGRNEVAGALEVLELLSLKGCIVTADALHCHAKMAQAVLDRGGEYVLALKDNQHALLAEATALLDSVGKPDRAVQPPTKQHDRAEQREAVVVPDTGLAKRHRFPGVKAIARVECRRLLQGKDDERLVRYFLLSCVLSAARLLDVVRAHWSIENQLHWVLDVVFDEDRARNRADHGPANLAVLRKLALNALRSHPDKGSIRLKVRRAGWNDPFLLSILGHMR